MCLVNLAVAGCLKMLLDSKTHKEINRLLKEFREAFDKTTLGSGWVKISYDITAFLAGLTYSDNVEERIVENRPKSMRIRSFWEYFNEVRRDYVFDIEESQILEEISDFLYELVRDASYGRIKL